VPRRIGADGSFEWYVLNGHPAAGEQRVSDEGSGGSGAREAKLDLAKAKVLRERHFIT
jgi:hypothetical protein